MFLWFNVTFYGFSLVNYNELGSYSNTVVVIGYKTLLQPMMFGIIVLDVEPGTMSY